MILTEYDEDFNNKTWYEDGVEDGILKGKLEDAENLLKMRLGNVEQIALATKLPIEQIQEIQKKYL
jgi:predicted transposase YdaD